MLSRPLLRCKYTLHQLKISPVRQWDSCKCGDCPECGKQAPLPEKQQRPASAYRRVFNPKTWSEDFVETNEPEFYVSSDVAQLQPE